MQTVQPDETEEEFVARLKAYEYLARRGGFAVNLHQVLKDKLMLKRIASKECLPMLGGAARELYNSFQRCVDFVFALGRTLRSAPSQLPDACSCGDM